MANEIALDFNGILEIALKGLRRSAVFMDLGVQSPTQPTLPVSRRPHISQSGRTAPS